MEVNVFKKGNEKMIKNFVLSFAIFHNGRGDPPT